MAKYFEPGTQRNAINLSVGGKNLVSTKPFDSFQDALKLVRHRIKNSKALLEELGEITLQGIAENLRTAGHGQWAPLTRYTKKKRAEKGTSKGAIFPNQPILNETGQMFSSIDILRNTGKTLNIGVRGGRNAKILYKHEYGIDVPVRPLLYFSQSLLKRLTFRLKEMLEEILVSDPHRARVRKGRWYKSMVKADFSLAHKTKERKNNDQEELAIWERDTPF